MTGEVAESLAAMLKGQPHLRALNLNDTSLEDEGVSTIAQALTDAGDCSFQSIQIHAHQKLMLHILLSDIRAMILRFKSRRVVKNTSIC